MADNELATSLKFLRGDEAKLPADKSKGQVYFAYKNVGTAEKPSYTGAIYMDAPIGGAQTRVKMTANADIANKAINDSNGNNILSTYLQSLGFTDDGKQVVLIKGSGNNQTKIALPIASATKAGIVTTDAQIFGGTKTFATVNATNLNVTGSSGFNYSGIETATENKARPVWFAYAGVDGKPVVNTNFTYNPSTQTLTVANLAGTADKANKDASGQEIRGTYIKNISVNGTTLTITKGSNATSTITLQDLNNKVTQTAVAAKDYTNWRTVLWGASNSATEGFTPTTVTDGTYTSNNLSFQPSTGILKATIFKGNLNGNASTATKLQNMRNIKVSGGAVSNNGVNFDGQQNISIPVDSLKESYLTWGGKNFSGSFGPLDASLISDLGANRLAFGKAVGITVQYSRDGGTTWVDYGASDSSKRGLLAGGETFIIGKADSTNKATASYMLRIILDTDKIPIYTVLNKFALYVSTNGSSGSYCTIDASLESSPTIFKIFANKVSIGGWSGWNIINTEDITTYGNTSATQYGLIRFTFGCTGGSTTYNGLQIIRIMGFGGVGWTVPSNMARHGHIYSYNYAQDVAFPAQVTAMQFNGPLNGNATTASSATKATQDAGGQDIRATYVKYKSIRFGTTGDKIYLTESNGANGSTDASSSVAIIPGATASAAGIVTTGTQTFAGNKTFNSTAQFNDGIIGGSVSSANPSKIILLSQQPSYIGDSNYTDSVYFKALLKWICQNYKNKENCTFVGRVCPNSAGYASIYIYHTNIVDSTSGLPQYSSGTYTALNGSMYTFGTQQYAFYYRTIFMADNKYAGSASVGGSANSAVKLDSSAGSSTQPIYFSAGKPVACAYTLSKSVPADAKFTDTNTWRGIQDNLTSTSATDSLSARQGKLLNESKLTKDVWSVNVKCATWSRLCKVNYNGSVVGSTFILNVAGTRNSVVYNDTFLIKAHHSSRALITKLSGCNYSSIELRVLADSGGNCYVELKDSANGATSSNSQIVHCVLLDWFKGSVEKYTSFTDGTTLPSGFTVAATITTNSNSLQGNLTWGEITGKPSNILYTSGGTMTGILTLLKDQYTDNYGAGALNVNNSDLFNVNSIKFADLSDSAAEGLQWYRDSTHTDSFWVQNGVMYFTPNRAWGSTSATNYVVLHSGNYNSYAPSKTGTGASGNWNINVTGSAASLKEIQSSSAVPGDAGEAYLSVYYNVNNGLANNMPSTNNANAIINICRHAGGYNSQLGFSSDENVYYRAGSGTKAWKKILDSSNYSSYALPLSGGKMTGNIAWVESGLPQFSGAPTYLLGIDAFASGGATKWANVSAINVGSATKLQTARTLWGQSFDGSKNISGDISGATRIYNTTGDSNNTLNLGNSNNKGWVATQDIRSDQGTDKWVIKNSGIAGFKNVNIGYEYSKVDNSYALKVQGNSFYSGHVYFGNGTTYYINSSADANLRAVGTCDKTYIAFPQGGGFRTNTEKNTGYLKITLPQSWTSTMIRFKISMYQYQDNTSCDYYVGGYNYSGTSCWINTFAYSVGKNDTRTCSNLTVRFGHDGSKCAIYIGESTTLLYYPQIQISDIIVGYSNYEYSKWATGWSVGFTTTLGTITRTISNPNVSYSAATLQTNAGSSTKPVYFSGGIPVQCNDTLANNISGKSASTDAINWVAGNEIRFTKPNFTEAKDLHIGWAWSDGSKVKLINSYRFDGGDGNLTQVSASQFNGALNGNAATATNADKLDGYHGSSDQTANTYVLRNSSGYIYTNYINSNTNNGENPTISQIIVTNGSDGFYRKATLAHLKTSLGSMPASDVYAWAKASTKPSYSWGEITGKPSTFTPASHNHSNLITAGDNRSVVTTPNNYSNNFIFQGLKYNSTIGITDAGTYSYVFGLRGWADSSGGDSHELAFNGLGIYTRNGATTSWNTWRRILDSSNYTSYTVTKTGSGASGTWGISVSGSSASCTGNAATATKLQTARTITLSGAVTGSVSFDGSANATINTSVNHSHSQYLPLAGGTMTGTINFNNDLLACNFRANNASYRSGVMHQSSGNEALVFAAANAVTSFIFKCGKDPVGMTSSTWTSITPSMQIKNQSVYINSLIASGTTPSYNLYVNGSTRCNGTLGVGTGSSAEIDFFPTSSTATGAKIVAYSDRIEFVFN